VNAVLPPIGTVRIKLRPHRSVGVMRRMTPKFSGTIALHTVASGRNFGVVTLPIKTAQQTSAADTTPIAPVTRSSIVLHA
jgi:hypothetical protein